GGEEEGQDCGDGRDEDDDGDAAGRAVVADLPLPDAGDRGHKNDGKERADVEDQELFLEGPGERKQKDDGEDEEDVAANFGARLLLVGGEVFWRGVGQPDSPVGTNG